MRKFSLSAALAVILFGGAIAGAGVIGTLSIASHLIMSDPTPAFLPSASTKAFVDGRVPVRLRTVNEGTFAPASRAAVTFARNGQSVLRTDVIDGGTVQTEGLTAGTYSIFVQGPDGFAAFSTLVDPAVVDQPAAALISVGLVPQSDLPTVRRLIDNARSAIPRLNDAPQEVSTSTSTSTSSRSLVHGSGLELSADGTLRGRAVRTGREGAQSIPFGDANVYFVHNNVVLAEAVTDADGLFVVNGLASGIYSLVVTHHSAFVAISVEVAPASAPFARTGTINEFSLASFKQGTEVPEVSLVYEEDCIVIEDDMAEEKLEEDAPCCDGMASGASGGGGGGGGGGYGGGGLGALIGGALLGAGIYAIADDNNNHHVISPPAP